MQTFTADTLGRRVGGKAADLHSWHTGKESGREGCRPSLRHTGKEWEGQMQTLAEAHWEGVGGSDPDCRWGTLGRSGRVRSRPSLRHTGKE